MQDTKGKKVVDMLSDRCIEH